MEGISPRPVRAGRPAVPAESGTWAGGESPTGTVDILSADKSAGHASGFDDALIDELGLLGERDRALVNGLRTSTSAKDGRFLAISIMGDAPFTRR